MKMRGNVKMIRVIDKENKRELTDNEIADLISIADRDDEYEVIVNNPVKESQCTDTKV